MATFARILIAKYFFHSPWRPKWSQLGALDVSKMKIQKRRPKTLWSKTKTHRSKKKTHWSKMKTHWSKTKTLWPKTKTHRSKTKTHQSKTKTHWSNIECHNIKCQRVTNFTLTLSQSIQHVTNCVMQFNSHHMEVYV